MRLAGLAYVIAFAAGFAAWLILSPTSDGATPRASAKRVGAPPSRSPPHQQDLEREARRLRTRLDLYKSIPRADLVLHGEEPLAKKLRRIADLPTEERLTTLWRLGGRVVYSRDAAKEVLVLIREEPESEVLRRLADLILHGCITKLTTDPTFTQEEKRDLFIVVRSASLAERRIAAVAAIGGDRVQGLPAEVEEVIVDVLRLDPEPAVVRAAAEVAERQFGESAVTALLEAYRRLPAGDDRRRVATAYAKWAGWKAVREQFRRTTGPEQHDDWAHALSVWFFLVIGQEKGWEEDFLGIYGNTDAREIRRDLFRALTGRSPTPLELMRKVSPMEPDADLRSRYERILVAADSRDTNWLSKIDVEKILGH